MRKRGWEDTMQKWYEWLEEMTENDEKEKMEELHQHKVAQMIESAEGSAGLLQKISKPTGWRGGAQILKNEEEDARLVDRCEAKRTEWAKHWQCDEEVQHVEETLWKNEELRNWRKHCQGLKRCDLEKVSRLFQAKT